MVLFNVPYCTSGRGCVGKCEILKIGRLTVSALLLGCGYCLSHDHDSNEFVLKDQLISVTVFSSENQQFYSLQEVDIHKASAVEIKHHIYAGMQ